MINVDCTWQIIVVEYDFLGLCDQNICVNMCLILNSYGIITA